MHWIQKVYETASPHMNLRQRVLNNKWSKQEPQEPHKTDRYCSIFTAVTEFI